MTDYEIKHYQDGFEVEQAQVGTEVAKTFLVPHQTPAERLKEVYTREGFDPETRLYAFKDGKMIGFLTSAVLPDDDSGIKKANLTPPSVLSEHKEVEKLLYEKAIKILKKKGVQFVRSGFGITANVDEKDAKKLGYKKVQENYFAYNINLDKIDASIKHDEFIEFDSNKHLERCAAIISEEYARDLEWANNYYERIRTQDNFVRIHKLIEKDGEIKAYINFIENLIDPSITVLQVIYAVNEDYMKKLLSFLAEAAKKKNYKRFQCAFTEVEDIKLSKYKPIKFDFIGSTALFEKEI
ncbi:MAG: hypothetical protein FK733_15035 [Asgard group archaeon]|nr:hypothetical protein [Asgard group archaeon]